MRSLAGSLARILMGGALAACATLLGLAPASTMAVTGNDIIVVVAGTPNVQSSTGDNGPAINATLFRPRGVAGDRFGNVYISQRTNSALRRVNATGIISLVAGNYTPGYNGDGIAATAALLNGPSAVATDSSGQVYIADEINGRIRKIDAFGIITSIASGLNGPLGVAVDGAGTVYAADSGNHRVLRISPGGATSVVAGTGVPGYNGDGITATTAQLNYPAGVAIDGQGRLYISDSGRLRRVGSGVISTVAGTGMVGSAGDGGPATAAQVMPTGVAVHGADVYISEGAPSHRIRKIAGGVITTIAGNGTAGAGGNGGPARLATLNGPFNISIEPSGSLLIGDEGSSTVRRIIYRPPPPPTTGGGGGGAAPPPIVVPQTPRIDSNVSATWGVSGRKIYLLRLKATRVPARAKLQLRCSGKRCPFKRKSSKRVRKNAITLYKEIETAQVVGKRRRTFRAGQKLQVRITAPGFIGKVVKYKLRKGRIPVGRKLCLPLGASKPARC